MSAIGYAPSKSISARALLGSALFLALIAFSACDTQHLSPDEQERNELCKPVASLTSFEETPYKGGSKIIQSFQTVRAAVNTACANCHMAPSNNGGFTYVDAWQGGVQTIAGERRDYMGFVQAAEKMRAAIFNQNEKLRMPPPAQRAKNPAVFMDIGQQLDKWIKAGKPNGPFKAGEAPEAQVGKLRPVKPKPTSELGDCVPVAKAIGYDYRADRNFETMTKLPKYLHQTDMHSLDPYALAQTGTLAYNVEYPLWADNAEKGRWVHVPMKLENGELKKQRIELDRRTGQFVIPQNTRFYKSFYRAITLPNKKIRMRRMETRIIVSRIPWQDSLFGTYQWDESEQVATLVEAPYRDGTPWKDVVFDVVTNEEKAKVRPYAIPGRQRCIDCHMGSPMGNFVLGFQPIQINKRPFGGGGRVDEPLSSDLDQVQRFISYGLLGGIKSADDLPVLEKSGNGAEPRNLYELQANGYTVGNCYHCHNDKGLAFTKENGIKLKLGPGDLFQFNTHRMSIELPTRRLVHQVGDLDGSQIYRKVADPQAQQGMFNQMPMNTPGSPDCRVLRVMGKWIRSFESELSAEQWEPECEIKGKKENTFFWIDTDFTWPDDGVYTPRRNDWNDPSKGMPEKYRRIELSDSLKAAIQTEYPVGYWLKKPECKFPDVDLAKQDRRPWMMIGQKPKRPFGEVYYTTPGSYFFRNTCVKCHGPQADGQSSLARGILNWSGGGVRVANLRQGLFKQGGENLKTFDFAGKNYAGNYLIWMAMEGTRVRFPPEISSFMGKHGGQMLNGIREKCISQISMEKQSRPWFQDHEMFNKVCFMDNLYPGHPDLEYNPDTSEPLYPDRVEAWADRAAWNAGWAIFDFLKESSETGHMRVSNDSCEAVFPR